MSNDPYAAKESTYFAQGRAEMLRFVPDGVRRVLEVGCGRGDFIRLLRQRAPLHATGIEPFAEAAEAARAHADVILATDVSEALDALRGQSFDAIVFNDVLEHLVDPWAILSATRHLLAPQGALIASIPNMRYWPVLNSLLVRGEWRYVESGVLDRTHLRFFTASSMREMFEHCGFSVTHMEGINGTGLPLKASMLNKLLGGRLDDCQFPQFATVAHKA